MTSRRLAGVVPAVPTPVDAAGEPDVARFLAHARWTLAKGCTGLNVLGTTGEANCFSAAQRRTVMEVAARELPGTPMMVGTGTPDLPTTIALTRHAHGLGFAGALVLPPWYYKNVPDDGLFDWYRRLAVATQDAPIPLYFYNFPRMTGVPVSAGLMARLKQAFPDRIAGAKDSSGDFEFSASLLRIEDFDVFPGSEIAFTRPEGSLYAGCISATVNALAPMVVRYRADRSDAALGARMTASRNAIGAQPLIPAIKYLAARIHGDAAFERVLPPHMPLDAGQKAALDAVELQ